MVKTNGKSNRGESNHTSLEGKEVLIRGKKFTARQRRAGHGLMRHPAQCDNFMAQCQPLFIAIILSIQMFAGLKLSQFNALANKITPFIPR